MTLYSSASLSSAAGTTPAASNWVPLWMSRVASPPSSSSMFGPAPSGQVSICSVHHQYSSRVSPFQAKTGTPAGCSGVPFGPTTTAAAAWSWVEKMLQLTQRTSAPRATSVSMSTAVWVVMCSEPAIRAPRRGWVGPNSSRRAIRPGISCSASWISLRPKSASEMSATLKSMVSRVVLGVSVWALMSLLGGRVRAVRGTGGAGSARTGDRGRTRALGKLPGAAPPGQPISDADAS